MIRSFGMIGWFGIPGGLACDSTKTHVIVGKKLLCGAKVSEAQEFQFCAFLPKSNYDYIECRHCLKKVQKT